MTDSITNQPAPQWLRDLARGRASYEELLGWPVTVQVTTRTLTLHLDDTVSALTMPVALGTVVRRELGVAMQHAPVISDPEALTWTFLTRPPEELRSGVAAALALARVTFARAGCQVVVPTSPLEGAVIRNRQWIDPPTPGRTLPPAYPVISVARRLTEHRDLAMGA
jgi:hypothetical protein